MILSELDFAFIDSNRIYVSYSHSMTAIIRRLSFRTAAGLEKALATELLNFGAQNVVVAADREVHASVANVVQISSFSRLFQSANEQLGITGSLFDLEKALKRKPSRIITVGGPAVEWSKREIERRLTSALSPLNAQEPLLVVVPEQGNVLRLERELIRRQDNRDGVRVPEDGFSWSAFSEESVSQTSPNSLESAIANHIISGFILRSPLLPLLAKLGDISVVDPMPGKEWRMLQVLSRIVRGSSEPDRQSDSLEGPECQPVPGWESLKLATVSKGACKSDNIPVSCHDSPRSCIGSINSPFLMTCVPNGKPKSLRLPFAEVGASISSRKDVRGFWALGGSRVSVRAWSGLDMEVVDTFGSFKVWRWTAGL